MKGEWREIRIKNKLTYKEKSSKLPTRFNAYHKKKDGYSSPSMLNLPIDFCYYIVCLQAVSDKCAEILSYSFHNS